MPHNHLEFCVCESPTALHTCFDETYVGRDLTNGHYADVTIKRCRTCGRNWLRYCVEYQAFSRSNRWARGLILGDDASHITPEKAAAYLAGLPEIIRGGSYYDGVAAWTTGPVNWDL